MNPSATAEQGADAAAAIREAVQAMAAAQQAGREVLLEQLAGLLAQVCPATIINPLGDN